MNEKRLQELEVKVTFLERQLEELDKAFIEVNRHIHSLNRTVERLVAQQSKNQSHGGEESPEDAVPPHY